MVYTKLSTVVQAVRFRYAIPFVVLLLAVYLLEWHARAMQGARHDTWMRGRFLEEWADPRAVAQLSTVFAH